ncbi:hypothetical protein MTAT_19510 [Moorella thermoacetica]|uniref:Metallophosphoesterase YhaO n=1 Tax=Neomoorella thermoacetica TaxID=1525 RepID=A0AAC9HIP6_NEOTH|nr:putative metallophosphoesterase YhaO [Moorella thermoacetica]TYL12709.1 hypothetical protein MTAT_19510 [Moorella thermoacetica]
MRILVTADLHFCYRNYGKDIDGVNSRLLDYQKSWDYLIDYALQHDVDLMIIAGDLLRFYHNPRMDEFSILLHGLQKLQNNGVSVLAIRGNHDAPELMPLLGSILDGAIMVDKIDMFKINGLQIACLPYQERQTWNPEVLDQYRGADILVLHDTLQGAVMSNGLLFDGIPLKDIKDFPVVIAGHIHKYQVLNSKNLIFYPGSLEPADFGEAGQEKGFVVLDIHKTAKGKVKAQYEFVPVPHRKFAVAEVTAADISQLDFSQYRDKVLRLFINGTKKELGELDLVKLVKEAEEAGVFYLDGPHLKTLEESQTRVDSQLEELLTPDKALRLYLDSQDVEDKEEIINLGLSIIDGGFYKNGKQQPSHKLAR